MRGSRAKGIRDSVFSYLKKSPFKKEYMWNPNTGQIILDPNCGRGLYQRVKHAYKQEGKTNVR